MIALTNGVYRENLNIPRYAELGKVEEQPEETAEDIIERISNNLLSMGS